MLTPISFGDAYQDSAAHCAGLTDTELLERYERIVEGDETYMSDLQRRVNANRTVRVRRQDSPAFLATVAEMDRRTIPT